MKISKMMLIRNLFMVRPSYIYSVQWTVSGFVREIISRSGFDGCQCGSV